jgi:hypothetical protein
VVRVFANVVLEVLEDMFRSFFGCGGVIHFKCFLKSIQFFLGMLHFWWDILIALVALVALIFVHCITLAAGGTGRR